MANVTRADFRKFTCVTGASPQMSMGKGGKFTVNGAAIEHFKLEDYKFVVLYSCTLQNCVGIEFSKVPIDSGIALRQASNKNGGAKSRCFTARGFAEKIGVPSFRMSRLMIIPDQNMYYVEIKADK